MNKSESFFGEKDLVNGQKIIYTEQLEKGDYN